MAAPASLELEPLSCGIQEPPLAEVGCLLYGALTLRRQVTFSSLSRQHIVQLALQGLATDYTWRRLIEVRRALRSLIGTIAHLEVRRSTQPR